MLFESGPRTLFLGMAVLVAGLVYLLLLKVFKVSELELLRGILKFR